MDPEREFEFKAYVLQQWHRDVERVRRYVDVLAGA